MSVPDWTLQIYRLLFANDLVLLSFTEFGLQSALNDFTAACNSAGMNEKLSNLIYFIFRETLISVHCK